MLISGIEVTKLANGDLLLNQSKYIRELLHSANMENFKPSSCPSTTSYILLEHIGDAIENPSFYISIIGALKYITITRLDLSYAMNKVCPFKSKPHLPHWDVVKRILRYLLGALSYGIVFKPSN